MVDGKKKKNNKEKGRKHRVERSSITQTLQNFSSGKRRKRNGAERVLTDIRISRTTIIEGEKQQQKNESEGRKEKKRNTLFVFSSFQTQSLYVIPKTTGNSNIQKSPHLHSYSFCCSSLGGLWYFCLLFTSGNSEHVLPHSACGPLQPPPRILPSQTEGAPSSVFRAPS